MTSFPSSLVASAINHVLEQDPNAKRQLASHAGKVARIDAGLFDLSLAVNGDGSVRVAVSEAPSVSIQIKAADLPRLLQDRERAFSYVRLEGDAEFANAISQLAQNTRWDAEADLARVVGDIAAVRVTATARQGWEAARTANKSLLENVAEYLLEENPTLVSEAAARRFGSEVNVLRDDVERLAKRIEKLKGRA